MNFKKTDGDSWGMESEDEGEDKIRTEYGGILKKREDFLKKDLTKGSGM